jgi:hypothetical protein
LIKGISAKDISFFKVVNSAQFRSIADLEFNVSKTPEPMANYYFIELPVNTCGTEKWHINYLNAERSDPLELPFVVNEQYSYEFTLPENITLINPVELTEMKANIGELILSTSQQENKITIKRLFKINQKQIAVSEYDDFKKMFDIWNEENFRKLVLRID